MSHTSKEEQQALDLVATLTDHFGWDTVITQGSSGRFLTIAPNDVSAKESATTAHNDPVSPPVAQPDEPELEPETDQPEDEPDLPAEPQDYQEQPNAISLGLEQPQTEDTSPSKDHGQYSDIARDTDTSTSTLHIHLHNPPKTASQSGVFYQDEFRTHHLPAEKQVSERLPKLLGENHTYNLIYLNPDRWSQKDNQSFHGYLLAEGESDATNGVHFTAQITINDPLLPEPPVPVEDTNPLAPYTY